MPFCTACGKQNPDDARFCSQCGSRLVPPDTVPTAGPTAPGEGAEESTATINLGAGEKVETSDRQLNPVDAAAVDALPVGHALLVVQRGPGSGSRFLLDADVVMAGRHPDTRRGERPETRPQPVRPRSSGPGALHRPRRASR